MKPLETLVDQLSKPVPLEEAAQREGLPFQPGLYAWWVSQPGALPQLPLVPREDGLSLLYVGMAPSSKESKETLRSRVAKKHIRGTLANSTFRRTLVALLWQSQGWQPQNTRKLVTISRADNEALTRWMDANLRVAWAAVKEPWSVEASVLASLKPPLNQAQKPRHPLHAVLCEAHELLEDSGIEVKIATVRPAQKPPASGPPRGRGGAPGRGNRGRTTSK